LTKDPAFLDRTSAAAHTDLREQKKIRAGAAALEKGQDTKRKRTHSLRPESDHDSRREVEDPRAISALARLVHALREEGIRFQVAGMSAAILQGVPATTLDTDLWVELLERQEVFDSRRTPEGDHIGALFTKTPDSSRNIVGFGNGAIRNGFSHNRAEAGEFLCEDFWSSLCTREQNF
jgi:hypothetical protein